MDLDLNPSSAILWLCDLDAEALYTSLCSSVRNQE